ncbi:MAG: S41 family peptidase [Clostridia bacterium]|nr:S41 family peptidase [Clostridia bacterium]
MYQKKHLILIALVSAFLTLLVTLTAAPLLTKNSETAEGKLLRARDMIMEHYVDSLTPAQMEKMDDAAIGAMVASLGDPYSRYMNEASLSAYEEDKAEEYFGIGMEINFSGDTGEMLVTAAYDGSPAQKAGVMPQDRIVAVDEMVVSAETYNQIMAHIKDENAKEGDEILLTIERGEEKRRLEIPVKRAKVAIQTVTSKMLGNGIGFIRLSQFIHSTAEDFDAAVAELKNSGMRGLIIDLRSNPGGYASSVLSIADSVLPEGTIAYLEDNKGRREYFKSDENELGLPMVVLINNGTASAAELLAGSIKAYELGTLVGEKSYGKAVGQSVYPLTNRTALYLTHARYYTPKGECIDKKGIEPDVFVELPEELYGRLPLLSVSEDPQLSRAVELMLEKIGA